LSQQSLMPGNVTNFNKSLIRTQGKELRTLKLPSFRLKGFRFTQDQQFLISCFGNDPIIAQIQLILQIHARL
jgi:hypothetical protein